jgi:hypothetical protein
MTKEATMKSEGKEQIERLTRKWYGATAFAILVGWLFLGSGIVGALIGLAVSVGIVFFIGRKLAAGSSAMRTFCLAMSVLGMAMHGFAAYRFGASFVGTRALNDLAMAASPVVYVYMNAVSLRVLLRKDVRSLFA